MVVNVDVNVQNVIGSVLRGHQNERVNERVNGNGNGNVNVNVNESGRG